MLNQLFWIVPICSVIALLFAWFFFKGMMKESEGNETMKRIAGHVRKGAMAYLRQQYKIVGLVFLVLCLFFAWMAYGPGLQNGWVWFAFLTGGFFSGLAGFIGMKTATYASARTANAASRSMNDGLKVAFRSGAVMGLVVVGLGFAGYFFVVAGTGLLCRGSQMLPHKASDDYDYHADFRYGGFYPGLICPCREAVFLLKRLMSEPIWSGK